MILTQTTNYFGNDGKYIFQYHPLDSITFGGDPKRYNDFLIYNKVN